MSTDPDHPCADTKRSDLLGRITRAINSVSAENGSNTPDFILGEFLVGLLQVFDAAVNRRETWYGRRNPHVAADPMPSRHDPAPAPDAPLPPAFIEQRFATSPAEVRGTPPRVTLPGLEPSEDAVRARAHDVEMFARVPWQEAQAIAKLQLQVEALQARLAPDAAADAALRAFDNLRCQATDEHHRQCTRSTDHKTDHSFEM